MTAVQNEAKAESVLLNMNNLLDAHKQMTRNNREQIDGLYFDGGKRMNQATVTDADQDEDVEKPALAHVAKAYERGYKRKLKACRLLKKDEEEYDDEESGKRATEILDQSTGHEKLQYKQLFDFFDVDKDRTWGTVEFAQRMTDIGCDTSVEASANLLYFAGVRDVDRITYNDFIHMMPKLKAFRRLVEKQALKYYAEKDVNGRGVLSPDELREVIFSIAGGENLSDHQVRHLIRKADRERTGFITYDFFIRAMFGTPPVLTYEPKAQKQSMMTSFVSNFSKAFSSKSSGGARRR